MNSRVSILTVVYNGEAYLEDTIKSVIGQDYDAIEYVVIDGGSTDGTRDILERYRDHIDVLVSEPDKGIYDAINKGIGMCSGLVIKIQNADDLLLPDAVSVAMNVLREFELNEPIILIGNSQVINSRGRVVGRITERPIMLGFDSFNHPGWFVTAAAYRLFGLYSDEFRISSDYEYYLRFKTAGGTIVRIPNEVACYRQDGRSSGFAGVREVASINRRYFGTWHAGIVWVQHVGGKLLRLMKYRCWFQVEQRSNV